MDGCPLRFDFKSEYIAILTLSLFLVEVINYTTLKT